MEKELSGFMILEHDLEHGAVFVAVVMPWAISGEFPLPCPSPASPLTARTLSLFHHRRLFRSHHHLRRARLPPHQIRPGRHEPSPRRSEPLHLPRPPLQLVHQSLPHGITHDSISHTKRLPLFGGLREGLPGRSGSGGV